MALFRNKKSHLNSEEIFTEVKKTSGLDPVRLEGVMERPLRNSVFIALIFIFILFGTVLVGRAAYLTIIEGEAFSSRADKNHLQHETVVPPRGVIYDRNRKPLAFNEPGFRVVVDVRTADASELRRGVEKLATLLERDSEELISFLDERDAVGEIVVELIRDWNIAQNIIAAFSAVEYVRVEPTQLRVYVEHPAFSHLIGYVSRVTEDDVARSPLFLAWGSTGRTGIERTYDDLLRGSLGTRIVETDSRGTVLSEGIFEEEKPGESLVLSIDADLQITMYEAIGRIIEERGFTGGSAVALDARTGEVVGMVSYPGFDANMFTGNAPSDVIQTILTDKRHPLFFRAVAGLYPPASTIKPFLAAAAVTEGLFQRTTRLHTNGRLVVPNPYDANNPAIFNDWKDHGTVDMIDAIAVSSDVYFYIVGGGHEDREGLGEDRIAKYLRSFGFGVSTGVDLPGEEAGLVPDHKWKAERYPADPIWRLGDTYNISIGQGGMLATPLQMARATLALARGGAVLQPELVREVVYPDGSREIYNASTVVGQAAVSAEGFAAANRGMREAVVRGTASGVAGIKPLVAAKTGTAEVGKTGRVHSWFIGFLPWEEPNLILAINLEDGSETNLVGATAAAHEILQKHAGVLSTDIIDSGE